MARVVTTNLVPDTVRRGPATGHIVLTLGALSVGVGYVLTRWAAGSVPARMLPWILGRGLGIAAYIALVVVTLLGLWLRHPWRLRRPLLTPAAHLRLHAALAATTVVLVTGHIIALVLDRFAGVGLVGAFVPGQSGYRATAVGLGTVALYLGLLVGLSAALAGRLVGRAWLPIHRTAVVAFLLVWLHGVLAGSDTPSLRLLYAVTGGAVTALAITRRLARVPAADVRVVR
jgi:DMSO/TMAO reductase YedYZ heme-binding membrane subunit